MQTLVEYNCPDSLLEPQRVNSEKIKCEICSKVLTENMINEHLKEHGEEFYDNALKMQKNLNKRADVLFDDIVGEYVKAATLGNQKAIGWLDGQFGTPVTENSIWNKNRIYHPESVNLRNGVPAIVHSLNRKSRRGQ